jgi:CofD-related protein of GAK system
VKDPREVRISVQRRARIPDPVRLERYSRLPEFGPRIFFFSGGSALRETSRVLKRYTHNSVHLITPFDSGGSSASLREAFSMLGVGDLRNRLMALADETELGSPNVKALFSHRLDRRAEPAQLARELEALVEGNHPLLRAVPRPLRRIIRTHLRKFAQEMPEGFELRGANIGNLILAGGYLVNERDLDSVLYLFSKLVSVRGTVRPTALDDLHLVALHDSGRRTVGQHLIGKPERMAQGRIVDLELVREPGGREPVSIQGDAVSLELIDGADLICFPMGSFFGSVLANFLPTGVGRRVRDCDCPKVYIPNAGCDPEMRGYSLSGAVEKILEFVRRDAGADTPVRRILDFVLIDGARGRYDIELDLERLAQLGVPVIDTQLVGEDPTRIEPQRLVEVLLSLA